MSYWTASQILKQATAELGLPYGAPTSIQSSVHQGWALLNSAGNDLVQFHPWAQLLKEWEFVTEEGKGEYALPADWSYFIDQTQWDRTDHWPLLGPKSPQEWAWLKGGLLAAAPRMRYRVMNNNFMVWPVPGDYEGMVGITIAMEYVNKNWALTNDGTGETASDMVAQEADVILFNPWLVIKYLKLKFYETKGFNTEATQKEFVRMFLSLTGKDKGAPKLSLAPIYPPLFIGPWSIPDGSWDTSSGVGP
jgi:hypothetical protein